LFAGRYKALPVEGSGNGYLQTVCDYVHLNPARAGLLEGEQPLEDWLGPLLEDTRPDPVGSIPMESGPVPVGDSPTGTGEDILHANGAFLQNGVPRSSAGPVARRNGRVVRTTFCQGCNRRVTPGFGMNLEKPDLSF
jgi:hypothetical protein